MCFVLFFERSVKVNYSKVDLILCLLSVNNFAPCALKNSIQKIHFMKRNRKKTFEFLILKNYIT